MNNQIEEDKKNIEYPKKKFIDIEVNKKDIADETDIFTNLSYIQLKENELKNVYIFGCYIEEQNVIINELDQVNVMRRARRIECFKKEIEKFVTDYYISGLVLIGRALEKNEEKISKSLEKESKKIKTSKTFSFFISFKEFKEKNIVGKILDKPEYEPKSNLFIQKIYKFSFKQKKKNLYEIFKSEKDKYKGYKQYISTYLNICLGKLLKRLDFTKDRSSKKMLYYKKDEINKIESQKTNYLSKKLLKKNEKTNSNYFYLPALKAVCETFEYGNIFVKLLPRKLVKLNNTYHYYFYKKLQESKLNIEEMLIQFNDIVKNKSGMRTYNQSILKIDEIIYENPYHIKFKDRKGESRTVGNYYKEYLNLELDDLEIPIAKRYIDFGGKLKGDDRIAVYVPCLYLQVIGNIFDEKISIKGLVETPNQKYEKINEYRNLIETELNNQDTNKEELHNYLGNKFDPVIIQGQIIKPPIIKYSNISYEAKSNGSFDIKGTIPYNKIKELKKDLNKDLNVDKDKDLNKAHINKVDIYLLDLDVKKGNVIWNKLNEAGKELGIIFDGYNFYQLKCPEKQSDFEYYIESYFKKLDEYYKKNKDNIEFIFLFMDSKKREDFYYRIFKSVINKFNWLIPSQVILYNDNKKDKNTDNLTKYTNILCQLWAKKGNELFICDFDFVPKTMVIAYSTIMLKKKLLTSICISLGFKLYEYIFYSDIQEEESSDSRISRSLKKLIKLALTSFGKKFNNKVENIVIYRDSVNSQQMKALKNSEVFQIKEGIEEANKFLYNEYKIEIYKETKWCLILVSKFNEIKLFSKETSNNSEIIIEKNENNENINLEMQDKSSGINKPNIGNVPVGTIVDKTITTKDKYDFYLNSANTIAGTSSSTHYTILFDNTSLNAMQIYKLTYYLSFLNYSTTRSIKTPAPLYFVSRRNKFTAMNLKNQIINQSQRTLNISL